jgi:1-phosphatidylinositol-4-phosphate 5-kinase
MRKSEMSVLLGMLEQYSEHMERYPNSLITRFFGLHKVTPAHGRSVSCLANQQAGNAFVSLFGLLCRLSGGASSSYCLLHAIHCCSFHLETAALSLHGCQLPKL